MSPCTSRYSCHSGLKVIGENLRSLSLRLSLELVLVSKSGKWTKQKLSKAVEEHTIGSLIRREILVSTVLINLKEVVLMSQNGLVG